VCVRYGNAGNFCGSACSADSDCPMGYGCKDAVSVEGGQSKQCVQLGEDGAPGQCSCSAMASKKKLQTVCAVEAVSGDGSLAGTCKGIRQCGASGLSPCTAPDWKPESCNGADDDCDGQTDEATCDDGNDCTQDQCAPQQGGCLFKKLSVVPCEADGSPCTSGDACQSGVCAAGKLLDCNDGNPCTSDNCDLAKGCTYTVLDGTPCNGDDSACTSDTCSSGNCQVGAATACDDGNPCTSDGCDPKSGLCKSAAAPDGLPCNDGTACSVGDVCVLGTCKGQSANCSDGNACTADTCEPLTGCAHTATDNAACDDENPCTVGDLCSAKVCQPGKAKDCSSGKACAVGECSPLSGACVFKDKAPGTPCDDGDACTQKDVCNEGVCLGAAASCDDANPCTADTCDAALGCSHVAAQLPCDDGDPCTVGDLCQQGQCASGATKACLDSNPCTQDGCDGSSGACLHLPLDSVPCDADGSVCTPLDLCIQGLCTPGKALLCDDANPCTDNVCNPLIGCIAVNNKAPCNDGDACTSGDTCLGGGCLGAAVWCNDGNGCTSDSCNPAKGCVYLPTADPCDDGNACTSNDVCSGGSCGGEAKTCSDGNVCTSDGCDPQTGCSFVDKNGAPCPDSDACTTAETCVGNSCKSQALACNDNNPCTIDSCDPKSGCAVVNVSDGADCGAGLWCKAGACVAKAFCGNGAVDQPSEQCDDGNKTGSDGCENDCTLTPNNTNVTFATCGQTGRTGPAQSQCDAAYGGGKVQVVSGVQRWTVPITGNYIIEAWGAKGGGSMGGKGARVKGTFQLQKGQIVSIVVGQMGQVTSQGAAYGGGGGGGTFVYLDAMAATPLLVAAGGGGQAENSCSVAGAGGAGSHTQTPTLGAGGTGSAPGGSNGNGGPGGLNTGVYSTGGGGGGWLSNGADGLNLRNPKGIGGQAPRNGAVGGLFTHPSGYSGGHGGFGGGGGMSDNTGAGGGGGGFNGGGGGNNYAGNCNWGAAGGGGSFNSGADPSGDSGVWSDHGKVTIIGK
jgi:cysteine-rich repeat protein